MVAVHREVERKLTVDAGFTLPDLTTVDAVTSVRAHAPFTMRAVYFDTTERTLFRWRITMRRREGGSDAGWHVKLPVAGADASARDELRLPLGNAPADLVPAALVDIVSPLLRGLAVMPLVIVETTRTPHDLLDASGRIVAEVVDDAVRGIDVDSGQTIGAFREIEVEATDGDDDDALAVVDTVATLLAAHGAVPSSVSKAARLLGLATSGPADVPDLPLPGRHALAADVMSAVLARHVRHLLFADVAVRRDLPDSVHQMRVACRRLRSTLKAFRPLLDEQWADALREELKWMATELGAIRDTEVLLTHLDASADLLPPADAQRAREVINPWLQRRLSGARSGALAALRSDRHDWLIDDLVNAVHEPRALDAAYAPADEVLPGLLEESWKPLAKAMRRRDDSSSSADWHRARIKAKGARYVAEALAPVFGKPVKRLGQRLAEVTEVLGEHQDAVVAQDTLRELSAHADIDAAAAVALGMLAQVEFELEQDLRDDAAKPWKRARRAARQAGVQ